jgi:nitrite reductase/ring-hydroxylating ferredoxin subunit
MKHELIKLSDIPATGSIIVPFFGRELHVYRVEGQPRAVANTCLHLGGPLECKDGAFTCPWHQARFDMATRERLSGPAPKGARLMQIPTRVEGDALYYVWGN